MFQEMIDYAAKAAQFLAEKGHGNAQGVLTRVTSDLKTLSYLEPGLEDEFHNWLDAQENEPPKEPQADNAEVVTNTEEPNNG